VLVPVAASVLLAGCSGGGSNGSTGTSASVAPSSATGDSSLKVPAALPTEDLLTNPCAALSSAQLTQIGLVASGRIVDGPPKGCSWKSSTLEENSISLAPLPQNKGGIGDIYSNKPKDAYFEPVTVGGYPGVFADAQDGRPSGACQLWVGVTDQLTVSVITGISVGSNKTDPCPIAQKVGEAMIAHLKSAA
jgi:hypothetical protein